MRRVAVIGCGGAGKTVLARTLGEALGLPVIQGATAAARTPTASPTS